jgi:hypothetical protein
MIVPGLRELRRPPLSKADRRPAMMAERGFRAAEIAGTRNCDA